MAKVYGMHLVRLLPDADPEAFEKFVAEKVSGVPMFEGWKMSLLKGERGDRKGQYLLLFEIESMEARNRVTPEPNVFTDYAHQFDKEFGDDLTSFKEEWERYSPVWPGVNTIFTDYISISD